MAQGRKRHLQLRTKPEMLGRLSLAMVVFALPPILSAQTETDVLARLGMRSSATYHFVEVLQTRGRWILPDLGYVDFGKNNYREVVAGGGYVAYRSKRFVLVNEGYLDFANGPAARGAKYFLPWTYFGYHLTSRLGGETVYFPYLPLNRGGTVQHVLDRAKLEYDFKHWKLGGGYAGYKFGAQPWQNMPLITSTLKAGRLGNFELWVERLPRNTAQVQLRYALSIKTEAKSGHPDQDGSPKADPINGAAPTSASPPQSIRP